MIYFFRAERDSEDIKAGWIKIGVTRQLTERIYSITCDIGHKPTLLGVVSGGQFEEWKLHKRFASQRRYREWFCPEASLEEFIGAEAKPWDGKDEPPPAKQPSFDDLPVCDGTVLAEGLIRLGFVRQTVAMAEVAEIVSERTGKPLTRQRLSTLLNSIRISPDTIKMIAGALEVDPSELMIR